jgi:hypothetical protein
MRFAVRVPLPVSQGGSLFRPLLKPQSSFQFSLPTELKSSRPPSTWQFQRNLQCTATRNRWQRPPSPSNSRSMLLGVALDKTPLGLPNTDFSCPNRIVDWHIELHSFLHLFSDLHIIPDFYGLQDVENYGALLPLLGETRLGAEPLPPFRLHPARRMSNKYLLPFYKQRGPASARFNIAKVCMG